MPTPDPPRWGGLQHITEAFEPLAARFMFPRASMPISQQPPSTPSFSVNYLASLWSSKAISIPQLRSRILALARTNPQVKAPTFVSRIQSVISSVPSIPLAMPFSQAAGPQASLAIRVVKKMEEYVITYPSILFASVGFCLAVACWIVFSLGYWGEGKESDGKEWVRQWAAYHGRTVYTPPPRRRRRSERTPSDKETRAPSPPQASTQSRTPPTRSWPSLPTLRPIIRFRARLTRFLPTFDTTPIDYSRITYTPGGFNTDDQETLYRLSHRSLLSKSEQRTFHLKTLDSSSSSSDVDSDLPVDEGYFSPSMTPAATPVKEGTYGRVPVTPTKGRRSSGFEVHAHVPTPPATPPMEGRRPGYAESVGGGEGEKEKRRRERKEREGRKKSSSRRSVMGF